MIVSISLPYNARYHKEFGAQLWFFYKQLGDFSEQFEHFTFIGWEKNHITPDLLPENCWELNESVQEKLEYSIPEKETVLNADVRYVDQKIFDELEQTFKSNNLVWQFLMTREYTPLIDFFRRTLQDIQQKEKIEAVILNCNLPSAKVVAAELNIPVIHTEIGPTRKPQYLQTAYWDKSGVNGFTEAAKRFADSGTELDNLLLSKRELRALLMSEQVFAEADSIADNPKYSVGVAGQVDDDSNIIAYSNGFNNLELLKYANFHFGEKEVLFRSHPAAQSYFTSTLDQSPSTVHFFKKIKSLLTINSSMALEACLFDKPVMVMGDSPFKILSDDIVNDDIRKDGHIRELNFLLLNYIIPYDLIFNYDYYRWRLSNPTETEIRKYHLDFYCRKKGFSSIDEFKKSIPAKNETEYKENTNPVIEIRACDIPGKLLHEKELVSWCEQQASAINSLEEKCKRLEFLGKTNDAPAPQIKETPGKENAKKEFDLSEESLKTLAETYFSNEDTFTSNLKKDMIPSCVRKTSTIALYYYRMSNGGVEKNISELLKTFTSMGYKTILLTDTEVQADSYFIPGETVCRTFSSGCLRDAKREDIRQRIEEWQKFIREEKIDTVIYQASLEQHAVWDLLAVKFSGANFLFHSHETCIMQMFSKTKFNALHNWKLSDGLICVSETDASWWKTLGCNAKYIPNNLQCIQAAAPDFSRSENDILWIGRISEEKQPVDAVKILKQIIRDVPDARLIFVGKSEKSDDPVYLELLKEIEENNLANHVVFTGFTLDVEKYYKNCAILLSTSKYESFSLTIIEAKSCGIPVAAYDLPNIEPFKKCKGHICTRQGDYKLLAENVVRLLKDRELREQMGKDAFESLEYFRNFPFEDEWKEVFSALENNLPLSSSENASENISIAVQEIMKDGEEIFLDNADEIVRLSDKLTCEISYYQHKFDEFTATISELKGAYEYNKKEAENFKALWEYQQSETKVFKEAYEYNESEAKRLAELLPQETAKYQSVIDQQQKRIEYLERLLEKKPVKLALKLFCKKS